MKKPLELEFIHEIDRTLEKGAVRMIHVENQEKIINFTPCIMHEVFGLGGEFWKERKKRLCMGYLVIFESKGEKIPLPEEVMLYLSWGITPRVFFEELALKKEIERDLIHLIKRIPKEARYLGSDQNIFLNRFAFTNNKADLQHLVRFYSTYGGWQVFNAQFEAARQRIGQKESSAR